MVYSEAKGWESRSRSESESEQGGMKLYVIDPKPR